MKEMIIAYYQLVSDYLPLLFKGLHTSLLLTGASLILAFLLATLLAAVLTLKTPGVYWITKIYITIFTGTPLLIQMYLIYYGPGQFQLIRECYPIVWQVISNVWFCAILALTLNSAAYTALLFHGALKAIPIGQWQACQALGMHKCQALRLLLPFALKRALPAYSNEIVLVFKSSSLVYTITLMDIMGYTKKIFGNTYDFSVFIIAGLIYLIINSLLMLFMHFLEKRLFHFEQR